MTKGDKTLVILLRFVGVGALFALVPVFMPMSWMVATHRWLGLGEMPTGPVVEYLARSVSAFYALLGALFLVMASDLERYRPQVRFFGVAFALLGIVFTGVDLLAGMPWWWTAFEGPSGLLVGALVFYLARPVHREALPTKKRATHPPKTRCGALSILAEGAYSVARRHCHRRVGGVSPFQTCLGGAAGGPACRGQAPMMPWTE